MPSCLHPFALRSRLGQLPDVDDQDYQPLPYSSSDPCISTEEPAAPGGVPERRPSIARRGSVDGGQAAEQTPPAAAAGKPPRERAVTEPGPRTLER